ncbi:MAG: hypothetical protein WC730_00515 [Patescibacteria group bacterium]
MSFGRVEYHKPKRKKPSLHARFAGMGDLMSGAMRRHGIERQITAAMIVEKAKEYLPQVFEPAACLDLVVISYQNERLSIGCRHSEAMYLVTAKRDALKELLEQDFPATMIRDITPVYRPELFCDEHGIIFT